MENTIFTHKVTVNSKAFIMFTIYCYNEKGNLRSTHKWSTKPVSFQAHLNIFTYFTAQCSLQCSNLQCSNFYKFFCFLRIPKTKVLSKIELTF